MRCTHTAIGLKIKHMESEAIPFEYQHACAQLLQLLALCPAGNVPWSLFDGGAQGENNIICRGSRVVLHGFVKATANNGRKGRVMEVHQDGTISVVFGCDYNCLSSVKPGCEVKRFKEGNVRLAGPLGAHEQLVGMQAISTSDSPEEVAAAERNAKESPSDMEPGLHDPQQLKIIAAYLKAVMPTIVHVDEVRRTFSMNEIVAGDIARSLGPQTERMRALLHCRCGHYLDEEKTDPRLQAVMREVTCVAAGLSVACRKLGGLEGEGWGCGMLLRIYETARETWGVESLVSTRCLTLAHAVLVADLCHQWLMKSTVTPSMKELSDVPAVREVLDACVGPFSFARCMRIYLGPDCSKLSNFHASRLDGMSWRYRSLRGSVETDEKVLKQIGDTLARLPDPAAAWDVRVIQMGAMSVAAMRLRERGLPDRSLRMYEESLALCLELLGAEHPHATYLKLQLFAQRKQVMGKEVGGSLENFLRGGLQLEPAPVAAAAAPAQRKAGGRE